MDTDRIICTACGNYIITTIQRGVGGAFGGGDGGAINHTRRGFEKLLFRSTIIIGILFAVTALASILI